jgi:acetyltransferase-like isoleucine patch superfamily enzyme
MRRLIPPAVVSGVGRLTVEGYRLAQRARNKGFSLLSSGAFAAFGRGTVIELPVRLMGESRIALGSGVFLGSGCWLRVGPTGEGVALEIGDRTSVAGGCVFSAEESVRIGDSVLIARNVYIADHMHAFDGERTVAVLDQGVTRVAKVEICSGAWLGQNVVVGPGVRVGRGAVIGSNSVVLSDVPDYSVAVGAPARVVRTFGPTHSRDPGGGGL